MSRYATFRRRLAPVAFGIAIVLLARETCNKQQRTHATMILDFGSAAPRVKGVDADLVVGGGDPLAHYHRVALGDGGVGPCTFEMVLPADDGELRLDIDLGDRRVQIARRFHASEGATVTVPLADALP